MKKLTSLILILALLAVPCGAAQQTPCTELRFGTPETVYGISAIYTVLTERVESVDVTFTDAVKAYAYANFIQGELRVTIASANPLDLSGSIGNITATLTDGTTTAPQLQLKSLRFNGKKAACNLVPGDGNAALHSNDMKVTVPVHNDFPIKCQMIVAAYKENGQMIACKIQTEDGINQDFTVNVTLTGCKDADHAKVFYLTEDFRPITGVQTIEIGNE